jgi:Ca2+-binding EF-hand superfamily protein
MTGNRAPRRCSSQPAAVREAMDLPSRVECDAMFQQMDVNGNGALSLAEIDKAIVESYPRYDHKPALMAAYHAADRSGDGFIYHSDFSQLLHYLVYFNNLWHKFEEIDADGDRRLTRVEFSQAVGVVMGLEMTAAELDAEFSKICEAHGHVLFREFCSWCARRFHGHDQPLGERRVDEPRHAEGGETADVLSQLWEGLTAECRGAASTLGWTQQTWDAGLCPTQAWLELTAAEQAAARALTFDEHSWNTLGLDVNSPPPPPPTSTPTPSAKASTQRSDLGQLPLHERLHRQHTVTSGKKPAPRRQSPRASPRASPRLKLRYPAAARGVTTTPAQPPTAGAAESPQCRTIFPLDAAHPAKHHLMGVRKQERAASTSHEAVLTPWRGEAEAAKLRREPLQRIACAASTRLQREKVVAARRQAAGQLNPATVYRGTAPRLRGGVAGCSSRLTTALDEVVAQHASPGGIPETEREREARLAKLVEVKGLQDKPWQAGMLLGSGGVPVPPAWPASAAADSVGSQPPSGEDDDYAAISGGATAQQCLGTALSAPSTRFCAAQARVLQFLRHGADISTTSSTGQTCLSKAVKGALRQGYGPNNSHHRLSSEFVLALLREGAAPQLGLLQARQRLAWARAGWLCKYSWEPGIGRVASDARAAVVLQDRVGSSLLASAHSAVSWLEHTQPVLLLLSQLSLASLPRWARDSAVCVGDAHSRAASTRGTAGPEQTDAEEGLLPRFMGVTQQFVRKYRQDPWAKGSAAMGQARKKVPQGMTKLEQPKHVRISDIGGAGPSISICSSLAQQRAGGGLTLGRV